MTGHVRHECIHGTVALQCKCPGPHEVKIVDCPKSCPQARDVHTEHCCVKHGCKYGYVPDYSYDMAGEVCTVVSLEKEQSFPCEMCGWAEEEIQQGLSQATPEQLTEELLRRIK